MPREKYSSICAFFPGNTNIPLLLRAMDCSLLPSFSEAFGMVAVESQLMNVPCFASTNVPDEVDIGLCSFIQLSKGASEWSSEISNENRTKKSQGKANEFNIDTSIIHLGRILDGTLEETV